ncbi:MAG: phosphonate metabolism protein PhnM [Aggregatilineales bacterium]
MWLTDARLVLPDGVMRGSLRIEDGHIAEVVEGTPAAADVVPLDGWTILPGIVDLHGDMLERDIEPRPGAMFPVELALYELDKRLAAAGITTAYAAVSFAWQQNDLRSQEKAQEIIRVINAKAPELLVDMRVHARFEVTNPATAPILASLIDAQQVHLVSIMDHTPGQGQYKNIPKYVDFMTRWLGFDPSQIGVDIVDRITNAIEEKVVEPRDWGIVAEVARLARQHNIPLASHDDDTPDKVTEQHALGVTISEFPVSEEAARAARERGMYTIMGAPNAYRGASTSSNLSARDAIRKGLVDILATDYFPAAMLHSAFLLARTGELPLHEAVKLISQHPADAMALHDRGRIAVGRRADLVLVEATGEHPRVRGTLRAGVPIYRDSTALHQALSAPAAGD